MLKNLIKFKKFLPIILTSSCLTFFVPFIHEIPSNIAMATNLNPTNECNKITLECEYNNKKEKQKMKKSIKNPINYKFAEIFLVKALNANMVEHTNITYNLFSGNICDTGSWLNPFYFSGKLEINDYLGCSLFLSNTEGIANSEGSKKKVSTLKFAQNYISNELISKPKDPAKPAKNNNNYIYFKLTEDFVNNLKKNAKLSVSKENIVSYIDFAIKTYHDNINNSNDKTFISGAIPIELIKKTIVKLQDYKQKLISSVEISEDINNIKDIIENIPITTVVFN